MNEAGSGEEKRLPQTCDANRPRGPLPGEILVRSAPGTKPVGRTGVTHGFHCPDAIEIPTSLNCSVCPLYHVKRRDRRHRLACSEGRKHQICPILTERQIGWAEELVQEIRDVTGDWPTASDRIRIEQIIRHRSRLFQVENYLKVAGFLDLGKGEIRNVGERLTTIENSLSRSLSEYRQAIGERRALKPQAPRLEEYLAIQAEEVDDGADD